MTSLSSVEVSLSTMAAHSSLNQLSSDLVKLYISEVNADVTFVFPDGEIKAHKAILSTRLPYFEKMFASGMKESLTNRVNMPEAERKSFDVFLRYIYGGLLPKDFEVEPQLNFAKMYDVPGLITDCLPKLKERISNLPDFDACIKEATHMMGTLNIEGAKSLYEQDLLSRIEDLIEAKVTIIPKQVPASFIDDLVKILILSHTAKCPTLKEKCLEQFAEFDKNGRFKSQIAEATKK